ncbi:MAG: hypothetical protein JO142_03725 [Burkholderiales bacterium]|nr:hypothetical protein [Burkholderiales bacterium]
MDLSHIYIGTRFWQSEPAKSAERLEQLCEFVDAMLALGVGRVGIAINIDEDCSDAINHITARNDKRVEAFAVTPWGKFVPALEALLQRASAAGFGKLFCASIEVEIESIALAALDNEVNDATLVAGLRMRGHQFEPGEHACDGEHSPWNTAALWRIRNGLDRIGFASSGEAHADPTGENAGVEEVSTIAIYQKLYVDCGAVLIQTSGVAWDTDRSSRPEGLGKKLRTKKSRAAWQLEHAGLEPGRVHHKELRAAS